MVQLLEGFYFSEAADWKLKIKIKYEKHEKYEKYEKHEKCGKILSK